jgi:transposase
MQNPHPFDLILGLDRADKSADLHLIDTRSLQRTSLTIDTSPEALWEWLLQLREQYPHARLGLCLEQPAAHLISFLEPYDWITLFPINPIMLQKFRETFVTSRAKDDAQDARYLAELLASHHDKLQAWAPEDSATRAVQQLVFHRRAVVDERTALTNRLQALLKQYFPQALALCGDDLWRPLATRFLLKWPSLQALLKQYFPQALLLCGDDLWRPLATRFLLKWPSLQALQKAKPAAITRFYYLHGSRSQRLLEQRLALVARAVAVTDQRALIESFVLRVQLICRQLQLVQQTVGNFDRQIAQAYEQHEDYPIFASLPGAGPTLGPRLLGSLGSQRERYPAATSLQCYTGVAPVTKKSGGSCHIHRRYLCPKFHKQSFHEYAKESILWSRWAAAYYLQQRTKGCSHHTAVRALAFKWQRIIWRCWQNRTPYSEQIYEAALRRRNSPIIKLFDNVDLGKSPFKNPAKKN